MASSSRDMARRQAGGLDLDLLIGDGFCERLFPFGRYLDMALYSTWCSLRMQAHSRQAKRNESMVDEMLVGGVIEGW